MIYLNTIANLNGKNYKIPYYVIDRPAIMICIPTRSVLYIGDIESIEANFARFYNELLKKNQETKIENYEIIHLPSNQDLIEELEVSPKETVEKLINNYFDYF